MKEKPHKTKVIYRKTQIIKTYPQKTECKHLNFDATLLLCPDCKMTLREKLWNDLARIVAEKVMKSMEKQIIFGTGEHLPFLDLVKGGSYGKSIFDPSNVNGGQP